MMNLRSSCYCTATSLLLLLALLFGGARSSPTATPATDAPSTFLPTDANETYAPTSFIPTDSPTLSPNEQQACPPAGDHPNLIFIILDQVCIK